MTATEQDPGTQLPGAHCDACSLHGVCLTQNLSADTLESLDELLDQPSPLKRGEPLVTQGDAFTSLYLVRSGSLKQVVRPLGQELEHVVGFYLPGETVGLEGIGESRCPASVVAMETTFVCALPYARLRELYYNHPTLSESLLRHMSRELRGEKRQLCLLSGRTAEQRLAGFLLDSPNASSSGAAAATDSAWPCPAATSAATWAWPWRRSVACWGVSSARA